MTCNGETVMALILGAVYATIIVTPIVLWCCGYRPGLNT